MNELTTYNVTESDFIESYWTWMVDAYVIYAGRPDWTSLTLHTHIAQLVIL